MLIVYSSKKQEGDSVGNNQLIFLCSAVVVSYKLCKTEGKERRRELGKEKQYFLCVFRTVVCSFTSILTFVNWVKLRSVFLSYDGCGINNNDFSFLNKRSRHKVIIKKLDCIERKE